MKKITVPFFISHQGCPHTCVFCDQRIISGSSGSLPSSPEIIAKIGIWRNSSPGCQLEVAFFGGTFTLLSRQEQQNLLAPLQPLINCGTVSSVRISTRPDAIDDSSVAWLAGMGITTIELGVQSMDNDVLAASGRGHDAAVSIAALECISRAGLIAGAQLMPGLPGDSLAASLRSLELVIAAGARLIRIYPVVVLRGTQLASRYISDTYTPLGLEEGVAISKVLLHTAQKASVDVIRIGLQDDEGLSKGNILAGCWHPAFGQLVYSELFFDLLTEVITSLGRTGMLDVRCHPTRISDVVGHKRRNILRLQQQNIRIRAVLPDEHLSSYEIVVLDGNTEVKGSIISSLNYDSVHSTKESAHA